MQPARPPTGRRPASSTPASGRLGGLCAEAEEVVVRDPVLVSVVGLAVPLAVAVVGLVVVLTSSC